LEYDVKVTRYFSNNACPHAPRSLTLVNSGDQRPGRRLASESAILSLEFSDKKIRTGKKENHSANFFSNQNNEGARQREILAEESLEMLIAWLHEGGNVAIHDATNSTKARRQVLFFF
jgi:hypothetical protein